MAKGSIRNYRAETKFLMEFLELKQITEVEEVKAHHTAKAFGIGTEIKDRTVKHLYLLMKSLLFRRECNHTSANASKVRSVLFRL